MEQLSYSEGNVKTKQKWKESLQEEIFKSY